METLLGIWMDHSRAEIVAIRGDEVQCSTIESAVERKHRALGGTRMPGRNNMSSPGASETKVDNHRTEQITRFFKQLIPSVRDADRVLVVGPGSAKTEFVSQVEKQKPLKGRIEAVKKKPHLSSNQFVALVKSHFKVPLTR